MSDTTTETKRGAALHACTFVKWAATGAPIYRCDEDGTRLVGEADMVRHRMIEERRAVERERDEALRKLAVLRSHVREHRDNAHRPIEERNARLWELLDDEEGT